MSTTPHPSTRSRPLRVLYVVFNYPQIPETYIESELAYMRRAGVHVEVWRHTAPAAPYPTDVPIHEGDFATAIARARPDVIHVHWMMWGEDIFDFLGRFGVPITLRAHTDFTPERARMLAAHAAVSRVYLYPHQLPNAGIASDKFALLPVVYDETMHTRGLDKDPKLVLRATSSRPYRRLDTFIEVAQLCPDHRFVLCLANCKAVDADPFVQHLAAMNRDAARPVDLRFDVPQGEVAALKHRAGTYLHTAPPDGGGGMPMSVVEAMASGCRVLVNGAPLLEAMVGDCGASYRDAEHAAELIRASADWSAAAWSRIGERASERARSHNASGALLPAVLSDWVRLAQARQAIM